METIGYCMGHGGGRPSLRITDHKHNIVQTDPTNPSADCFQ